jgi:hypothetical protein
MATANNPATIITGNKMTIAGGGVVFVVML